MPKYSIPCRELFVWCIDKEHRSTYVHTSGLIVCLQHIPYRVANVFFSVINIILFLTPTPLLMEASVIHTLFRNDDSPSKHSLHRCCLMNVAVTARVRSPLQKMNSSLYNVEIYDYTTCGRYYKVLSGSSVLMYVCVCKVT